MSGLTIDDLAKLIAQAPKPKKQRKKAEQTPEQRELMLEKLTIMREKSLENRNAKKTKEPVTEPKLKPQIQPQPQVQVQPNNDLFEKHYNSKFEKLEESIGNINNSINEIKQLKLEKAKKKAEKKEEEVKVQLQEKEKVEDLKPKEEGLSLSQVKTLSQGGVSISTPPQILNPNRIMKPNYKSFFKR
jgi:hypothetical protein